MPNMGKFELNISQDGATPGTSTSLFNGTVPDMETAIEKIVEVTGHQNLGLFVGQGFPKSGLAEITIPGGRFATLRKRK